MRFCPFCSAENSDDASHCSTCARRLPPLTPRRRRQTSPATPAGGVTRARVAVPRPSGEEPRSGVPEVGRSEPGSGEVVTGSQPYRQHPRASSVPPVPRRTERDAVSAGHEASGPVLQEPPAQPQAAPRPQEAAPSTPIQAAPSAPIQAAPPAPREAAPPAQANPPAPIQTAPPADDRAFRPPEILPVPQVPTSGILNEIRYAVTFTRARWQRRAVIRALQIEIEDSTAALDELLGALGQRARELRVGGRSLTTENAALDEAERRRDQVDQERAGLRNRQAEENQAFAEHEAEQQTRVTAAEADLGRAQQELNSLEAQRRGMRDKRKDIERQQKGCIKSAEEREAQAAKADTDDARADLLRAAEELRREALALDPERAAMDQRLAEIDEPIAQASAKVEALRAALDAVRRDLQDARDGHRHRLAELEAEHGRRNRELSQAQAEIQRRTVTLGMLINLHRVDRPEFEDLYARIDRLRGAIGVRTTEIERLTAERDGYDRRSLTRGYVALGVGSTGLLVLLVILIALL